MNKSLNYIFRVIILLGMLFGITHFSEDAFSQSVPLGEPGLSFRYEQTFGKTGEAYLADTSHLFYPSGVTVDALGNLWVAESFAGRIMKYRGTGAFLWSMGTAGSTWLMDYTYFGMPSDIAMNDAGSFWVADPMFMRVAKYDSSGAFLMVLGTSDQSGSDNDHFNFPTCVSLDSAGNIYVCDRNNQRIQIFTPGGVYSATIGETGTPGTGDYQFNTPNRVAIDDKDNLYVADRDNHRVQVFKAGGVYSATIGGASGSGDYEFNMPSGVAVDAARIYVADSGNHRVQIFDRFTYTFLATLGEGYGAGDNQFNFPTDVALDAAGNIFVADAQNSRVQKFDKNLGYLLTFGTTGVPYLTDNSHFFLPDDVAVDQEGNIGVVEDQNGDRFTKLDKDGKFLFSIGQPGVPGNDQTHFNNPQGVDFDAQGNIYIADCWNVRVQIFDKDGEYLDTLGSDVQFNCPSAVKVDPAGNILVADVDRQIIQVFNKEHTLVASLGTAWEKGSDDKHFNGPNGLDLDAAGNIYVADSWNFRVQKCSLSGTSYTCTTFAGETGVYDEDFSHMTPLDVSLDSAGRVYVMDQWNNRIQVYDTTGAYLTTIGGNSGTQTGSMDLPTGVAVDSKGNVYAADWVNHRVLKYAPGVPGWRQVNLNGFGVHSTRGIASLEVFNGAVYAGTGDWAKGGRIFRATKTTDWTPVTGFGITGTYTASNSAVIDLIEFKGKLYAGIGWSGNPGQVWRSADGTAWVPVVEDGFGDANNQGITSFGIFNNMLYAGASNTQGVQIWRTGSGDKLSWTPVVTDSLGYTYTTNVSGFAVFNSSLFAAIETNRELGGMAQVWRTSNGTDWGLAADPGFGEAANISTGGFAIFKGKLYLGTQTNTDHGQLWRTSGTTWEKVTGDGFGDAFSWKIEGLIVYRNNLYAFGDNGETGMQTWVSSDGENWHQTGVAGFGDSNNGSTLWSNAVTVYDGRLLVGTWNYASGGEIWEKILYFAQLPFITR